MGIVVPAGFVAEWRENGIHISPLGDLWPHRPSACECRYAGVVVNGVPVYTHNRYDGADIVAQIERGQAEPSGRIPIAVRHGRYRLDLALPKTPKQRPLHGGYPDPSREYPPHRDHCG